jgi:maleylacetate reductase
MSVRFVHESQPQRVCFGSGEAAKTVPRELERLGASKVMVIAAWQGADPARWPA